MLDRDRAIEVFGKKYVQNIEAMAATNAERLSYTKEGWERARGTAPFLIDMQFALDPDGAIGMRGVPVDSIDMDLGAD